MLILGKKQLHAGLSIIQSNEKIECNKQMKSTIMQEKNIRIVRVRAPLLERFAVVLAW